jgi:hypothetical protein
VVNQKDIKPIHPKTLKKIKDNLEEFSKWVFDKMS